MLPEKQPAADREKMHKKFSKVSTRGSWDVGVDR